MYYKQIAGRSSVLYFPYFRQYGNFVFVFLQIEKMNRKIFNNVQDAVEYLFSKEIEDDIVAIPPGVDELTDDEEIHDEKLDTPVIQDIAGKIEVILVDDECDETDLPSTSERKTKKLKTEKPKVVRKKITPNYTK